MFETKTMEIFSSRDMIRTQLIEYGKSYLEINDIELTKTSYLSYLINVLSVLTSNLIYYNTATYREFFLVRAQQKESVLNLAAMIGYTPTIASPSTSTVLLSIPTDFRSTTSFTLYGRNDPDHEAFKFYAGPIKFSLENEIRFSIIIDRGVPLAATIYEVVRYSDEDDSTITGIQPVHWKFSSDKGMIYFAVAVTQVEEQTETFTFPKMRPYEFYDVTVPFKGEFAGVQVSTVSTEVSYNPTTTSSGQVAYNQVQTDDDRVWWDDKSSMFLCLPGQFHYTYRVNENGIRLFFGNDIIGTQPTEGDTCTVVTSVTQGYEGNVIAGSIKRSDKINVDVEYEDGNVRSLPVLINCINTTPATGGTDYPTIDEIRSNAITHISTLGRLVTQYDFENASSIVEDLPIQHSFPILKRSDLKRNEIVLFTDILYADQYVPTRNSVVQLSEDNIIDVDGVDMIQYKYGDEVEISLSRYETSADYDAQDPFVSLFDIDVTTSTSECTYYYVLTSIEKTPLLKEYYVDNDTILVPTTVEFDVIGNVAGSVDRDLRIKIYYSHVSTGVNGEYSDITCSLEMDESGIYNDTTYHDTTNDDGTTVTWFQLDMDFADFTSGERYFDFNFSTTNAALVASGNHRICNADVRNIVKQDLSEFMYSKIRETDTDTDSTGDWGLMYDVPVVKQSYLDYLEENQQLDSFTEEVLHRIASFDMTEYRMLTDSVNLKFSNTTGRLTNTNFNVVNRGFVHGIDPDTIDSTGQCSTCALVYAVTNETNCWSGTNIVTITDSTGGTSEVDAWSKTKGGFLARYSVITPGGWAFTPLQTNDIVYYNTAYGDCTGVDIDECLDNADATYVHKMIYNGDNLHYMSKDIPVEVEMIVWIDSNYPMSENAFVNSIKTTLANHFVTLMGYDQPLYISDLTSVVQQIEGVLYCDLKKPEHDIYFDFDFDNFSHEDLLRYSPQLVYLDTNSMSITIRKR